MHLVKLDMNFDDTAFVHMLKDYSLFGFVPRLTFQNETIRVSHGTGLFQCCCTNVTFNTVHGDGNIHM